MDSSPSITPSRRLKRRSSSMMNLSEAKNLVEKDMVVSKLNLIRNKNLARRNFRHDMLVDRRNIDIVSIFEETPMPVRTKEPMHPIKQESSEFEFEKIELKYEIEESTVGEEQTSVDVNSKISNIKNKFTTFKNNVRNMISSSSNKNLPGLPLKSEPVNQVKANKPAPLDEKINEKINGQLLFKKVGQQQTKLGRFNSTSNVARPKLPATSVNVLGTNTTAVNSNNDFKRSLRNYDSCTSLRGSEKNNNKPTFKLSTKIHYNDSYLFATHQVKAECSNTSC